VRADLQRAYDAALAKPDDGSAAGRLAMLLHAYGQYQSADACYRRARHLSSATLAWAHLHGIVQAELGEHAKAARSFRQALSIDPHYVSARLRLADALMRAGELEASRAEYTALVREFPELALAHYGLGRVWTLLGSNQAAAEHFQRAVDTAPQFGAAHYALALARRDGGAADRAEGHLDAYRRLGPRRPAPPDPVADEVRSLRNSARELIIEGARLGREGKLAEATAVHLEALEADPAAAQAHVNLISLYGRQGKPADAERHYQAALALGSSLADAHYNYGVMLAGVRRRAEAIEAFRRALDANAFHAQAHNNLAALLVQEGKMEEAVSHCRQAIASDPQYRAARFNLGRLLVVQGRSRDAVEQFQRILQPEDNDTPRYMYALASALFAAGERSKGREYAEEALRRARALGQSDLAAQIEREIERMRSVGR
jgi:tetratricopeptide (TPR) repeat protein